MEMTAERRLTSLIPIDGRALIRAEVGPRPEQLWVAVRDLRIDRAYQRSLSDRSRALIREMVERWDWRLVQAITVAELPGGLWELIDGQHRAVAAITHGAIPMLPATVLKPQDRAEAARTFVTLNSRRIAVTAGERHRAAATAGDATAAQIDAACAETRVRLIATSWGSTGPKPGDTLAVGAMSAILRGRGEAVLRRALQLCRAADLAPIRKEHLLAVGELMAEPEFAALGRDAAPVVDALRDWDAIADAADIARLESGVSRTRALAVEIFRRAQG